MALRLTLIHPNKFRLTTFVLLATLLWSGWTQAAVLFEGYSKVSSGGVHIGYFISRYEYDTKTKIIKSTYYLRTNTLGGDVTESLRATSMVDLAAEKAVFIPVGYVYTTQSGATSTVIEASAQNGKLKAKVTKNGGTPTNVENVMPEKSFFSTFLAYMMLKGKDGISTGSSYKYSAVAEEDAQLYKGTAEVQELTEYNGLKAYKVKNEFKGQVFITYASQKGEMLATKSPLQSIETELVATPNDATKGIELKPEDLKVVFGDIPRGTTNSVSSAKTAGSAKTPEKEKAAVKAPAAKTQSKKPQTK